MSAASAQAGGRKGLVDTPYPLVDTDYVQNILVRDLLIKARGKSPEMDAKIADAFRTRFGVELIDEMTSHSVVPTYLHGPPGHGKTSVFKSAAAEVAEMLGLRLVINPGDDYVVDGKELLFVSLEMSGEVSSMTVGGMPAKEIYKAHDGSEQAYMTKLTNKRLAMLKHAACGVFLLDDFANASEPVQNTGLSIAEEGRFQGMDLGPRTLAGITGNLGTLDGTHTAKSSSAMNSRAKHYHVEDVVEKFAERALAKYNDDLADGGVLGFLQSRPDMFKKLPPKDRGPFATPRAWEKMISEMRMFLYMNRFDSVMEDDDSRAALGLTTELQHLVTATVGREVATEMAAYYYSMMTRANVLAREQIEHGRLSEKSEKIMEKKFSGGLSAGDADFASQFVFALADEAVNKLMKCQDDDEAFDETVVAMFDGMCRMPNNAFALGTHRFAKRLTQRAKGTDMVVSSGSKGQLYLASAVKQRLFDRLMEMDVGEKREDVFRDAITDLDTFASGLSDGVLGGRKRAQKRGRTKAASGPEAA